MSRQAQFKKAYPYQKDVLALPVTDLDATPVGNWRLDENNGQRFQVFFVVAPDGLCYYFHEPLDAPRDA